MADEQYAVLENLEREILDRVSLAVAGLSVVSVGVTLWGWFMRGDVSPVVFTGTVFVGSTISAIRSVPTMTRKLLLVAVSYGVGLASLNYYGYLAIPAISLILGVLLAFTLIGERFAIWSTAVGAFGILTIGGLQSQGIIPVAPGRDLFAPELMAGWFRVALLFTMVTVTVLRVIGSQRRLLVESVSEQVTSLEALRSKAEALELAVAERDRAEKRLRDAERHEAIGQLAGSVAHDMNNTLTVVLGSAEVLRKSELSKDDAALVEDMIQATAAGADLCRQLLSCARRSVLAPREIEPGPFVSGVARLFSRVLPPDAALSVEIEDRLPLVYVDEAELQHAILNLLGNARDAIESDGSITLETSTDGDRLRIDVRDDGAGIPAEIRERVFEPFFTTKEEGGGSGLGLPSVLGMAQQSGGEVELESRVGEGTTVSILIPGIVRDEIQVPTRKAALPSTPNILVVDDDPAIARLVDRILQREGFETVVVGSAEDAQHELQRRDFHILLTDVVLPGMRGPDLATWALARAPELHVVLMTGFMDEVSAQVASDRQMPVVPKPFTADELLEALRASALI